MSAHNELAAAAREVVKYWRDWPEFRRDRVRELSPFLANALNGLATVVETEPEEQTWRCCQAESPRGEHKTPWMCTQPSGHDGAHVATGPGPNRRVFAAWSEPITQT